MKKLCISLCLALTILTTAFYPSVAVQAQTTSTTYRQELSDGYYAIISTEITPSFARTSTKTATKTYNIYSPNQDTIARFQLTASFSYPSGNTAKCTSATYSTNIYNSNISLNNCSASKSGNTATGHFVIVHKALGIITSTESKTITLSCDKNGNIN